VSRLLLQAAAAQERVLADPGPSVVLMAFGADGLEFRLGYWIGDPENGSDNLRSLINLEILRLLRAHHIETPVSAARHSSARCFSRMTVPCV